MGFGKDGKGQIIFDSGTAALGSAISARSANFINGSYDNALVGNFRMIKTEYTIAINSAPLDQGPVGVYLIPSGLTGTVFEEIIESNVLGPNEVEELAQNNSIPLFYLGSLYETTEGNGVALLQGEKTIRWTFHDGGGWDLVLYNQSGSSYASGGTLTWVMKHYGVWVK